MAVYTYLHVTCNTHHSYYLGLLVGKYFSGNEPTGTMCEHILCSVEHLCLDTTLWSLNYNFHSARSQNRKQVSAVKRSKDGVT